MNNAQKYEAAINALHNTEPSPFNPDYDPTAKERYSRVTASMERDGYYKSHSREECAKEWRSRYDADKSGKNIDNNSKA